ncbi:MAG: hypothetical protein WCA82_07250 [Jiangellales bacterium]
MTDAGTLLTRLAAEYPATLREAHRLSVSSRPQTEEEVFALVEKSTSK